MNLIKGKVWRFGDNIDTDQIIPARYLVTGNIEELAKHAFENTRPEFAKEVQKGDIIVAGKNFGCGSSREHAPRALMGCGISCIIAKSFARIFFRNAINTALPVVECEIDAKEGEILQVDFEKGIILGTTTYKFKPLPKFLLKIMKVGGLVEYTKAAISDQ